MKAEKERFQFIWVVNTSADDISQYFGTPIGIFHSIYESDQDGCDFCAFGDGP